MNKNEKIIKLIGLIACGVCILATLSVIVLKVFGLQINVEPIGVVGAFFAGAGLVIYIPLYWGLGLRFIRPNKGIAVILKLAGLVVAIGVSLTITVLITKEIKVFFECYCRTFIICHACCGYKAKEAVKSRKK